MEFIELYFEVPKPETVVKPNMKCFPKVRKCRYCGINGDRKTLRYERGRSGQAKYDCRDEKACGARIRRLKGEGLRADDDCPF